MVKNTLPMLETGDSSACRVVLPPAALPEIWVLEPFSTVAAGDLLPRASALLANTSPGIADFMRSGVQYSAAWAPSRDWLATSGVSLSCAAGVADAVPAAQTARSAAAER